MKVKYRDIRPMDRFSVLGSTEEGATGFERDMTADLKPDDDVVIREWYGFPVPPNRETYLQWLEQELAECLVAVQKLRAAEADPHQFVEGKLMHQMECLRRVMDKVRFPIIRPALTGLR